jgi:glucose-6-phosphate dehydrogenase assembly protein OpcA
MISDLMRHCFEQTTILASGRSARALQSTLSIVLKAHLPVYLWWLGDTGNDGTFQTVAELCQRAIVDSATFVHPEQDLQTLATYCKTAPAVAISDLNWARLTLWRQLVAQFFDVSEYLPFLAGVESIDIAYATDPAATPDPTGALLLAGWLKARLRLYLATGHRPHLTERDDGTYRWLLSGASAASETLLQIQPQIQADLHPGSIYQVRLTCKAADSQAIFSIRRGTDSNYVQASIESLQQPHPMRTVNLPARHEQRDLLRKELEIMVHDLFFEQTLQELALLIDGA